MGDWGKDYTDADALAAAQAGPAIRDSIVDVTLAGNQNNHNPAGLSAAHWVRLDPDGSDRVITGTAAQADGFEFTYSNVGTGGNKVTFTNADAGSTAGNRYIMPQGSDLDLLNGESATFRYDGTSTDWRLISVVVA